MSFIRFILIVVAVYYLFKIIARYLLPYLVKRMIGKMADQMTQKQGYQGSSPKPEGKVTIEYKPETKKRKATDDYGEYVDYEEVK